MDIYRLFDNVINKDFMTYDAIFNDMVDWWYFNKDENVLILSANVESLSRTLHYILKKNKIVDNVNMIIYSDKCVIRAVSYSYKLGKNICLTFNIENITILSSFSRRGVRYTDVIIDINTKNLMDVELPFDGNIINECIYPMMVIPKSSRGNFLTLLY